MKMKEDKKANYILRASNIAYDSAQDAKLPSYKTISSLSLQPKVIQGLFQTVALKLGFRIIEEEETHSTAVYRTGCSFRRLFSCCFKTPTTADGISALKLLIELDETKCIRRISLKGLSGVPCCLTPQ